MERVSGLSYESSGELQELDQENETYLGLRSRKMIALTRSRVPVYLQRSEFFASIDDGDDEFSIPADCFKPDDKVSTNEDLTLLLSTMQFWGLATIPASVIEYVKWRKPATVLAALQSFDKKLSFVTFLSELCTELDQVSEEPTDSEIGLMLDRASKHATVTAFAAKLCRAQYEASDADMWNEETCSLAARLNRADVLAFLHEHGCPWDSETCEIAAQRGNLSCLKYAFEHGCPFGDAHFAAMQAHRVGCVQYINEHGGRVLTTRHAAAAATNYDLQKLERLRAQGCPWDESVCAAAARAGAVAILAYARQNGCPWDTHTYLQAALSCSVDCLRYAHKHGCPASDKILSFAVLKSSMGCVRYIHENIRPHWDLTTSKLAAHRGWREALEYGHGVAKQPWQVDICASAAGNGQLSCLWYLHEAGCPWDATTANRAARGGHAICLEYALKHGCPMDADTAASAAAGGLACLKLVHEHGCQLDDPACCTAAAGADRLACLQYLHERGCPWDAQRACAAVTGGSLRCLRYLHEHGCVWDTASLLAQPLTVKSRKCLEYAQDHPDPRPVCSCCANQNGQLGPVGMGGDPEHVNKNRPQPPHSGCNLA